MWFFCGHEAVKGGEAVAEMKGYGKAKMGKSKGPKDPVLYVKEKADEATDWTMIRQVQVNRAFYRGHQWISWDRVKRTVYVPELRPGEKRYTFNKIKPMVLTLLSKLTKNKVKLEVVPDSNEDERIQVARAALKFLHYQWQDDEMDYKSRRLKMHMLVDGQPALKVYVDKSKGADLPADMDIEHLKEFIDLDVLTGKGESGEGEEGEAGAQGSTGHEEYELELPKKTGKIVTEIVDQMSLKLDPAAEDISKIRWALEEKPMDVQVIKELWGKDVAPDGDIGMRPSFEQYTWLEQHKKYENMALVTDFWELPCPKYPNGRRIVIAGGELLEMSDNPGEFPFIFFPAIPIPGRAVADGIVTDLTTPQKSYNIKRTAEARVLEEMGNPMWIIPRGTIDDDQLISNEIGGILQTNFMNGVEPKRVPGASVDGGWQNAMNRDIRDMEDISGAHEISQGAVPQGNNTFGGLQLQVEQDETKLALLVHSYEDGIKQWGEKVLRLLQKHFPEEQMLKIVGENAAVDVFSFTGADLTGGELVDVVPNSTMPTIKAAEDQKVIQMWQMGMFIDPRTGRPDHRKVMRLLGQQVAVNYYAEMEQDENQALLENKQWYKVFEDEQLKPLMMQYVGALEQFEMMAQMQNARGDRSEELSHDVGGEMRAMQAANMDTQQTSAMSGVSAEQLPMGMGNSVYSNLQKPEAPVKLPIVRDFFDHEVHIDIHNRFRKSHEYEELPPELQQLVDRHVEEHKQVLAQMSGAGQQEMMMQQQQQLADQQAKEQAMKEQKIAADAQYKQQQLDVQREAQQRNTDLSMAKLAAGKEKLDADVRKFAAKLMTDRELQKEKNVLMHFNKGRE